jgi:hypothetical protein
MNVEHAIIHKQTWKSDILDRYTTGLLLAALRLLDDGVPHFNNDDVPEPYQPGDKTTVGAAFKLLALANIIEPWRGNIAEQGIYGGMRRSSRRGNNGHRNPLYNLTNTGIAREWLERHGVELEPVQLSLF